MSSHVLTDTHTYIPAGLISYKIWSITSALSESFPLGSDQRGGTFRLNHVNIYLIEDGDAASPVESAAFLLLREHLEAVLSTLGERERKVVQLRYGLDDGRPRTLEEIGRLFGVTRERIRQIESKTLNKLRDHAFADQLRGYLD